MDPLTAVLTLANGIVTLIANDQQLMLSLPEAKKAEYAQMMLEDRQVWQAMFTPISKLILKLADKGGA